MISIVLCEGKSDAILLSYYLMKTKGWRFIEKRKGPLTLPSTDGVNENMDWYINEGNFLAIWGVGGKDLFQRAINTVIELNIKGVAKQQFEKIVIVTDRDLETEQYKLEEISRFFSGIGSVTLSNATWTTTNYRDEFDMEAEVHISPIIVPFEEEGALETFLLRALSENEQEHYYVMKSQDFIDSLVSSEKYLNTPRIRLKAKLATTLAILSPEKVFHKLDVVLQSIPWENYKHIQEGFKILEEI